MFNLDLSVSVSPLSASYLRNRERGKCPLKGAAALFGIFLSGGRGPNLPSIQGSGFCFKTTTPHLSTPVIYNLLTQLYSTTATLMYNPPHIFWVNRVLVGVAEWMGLVRSNFGTRIPLGNFGSITIFRKNCIQPLLQGLC